MSKTITTKIWTTWTGQKIPVPLMTTEHIKSAYTRVREIIVSTENADWWKEQEAKGNLDAGVHCMNGYHAHEAKSPVNYETAKTFAAAFEAEAAKRKVKLPTITIQTYRESYATRQAKRHYSKTKFSKIINPNRFI